MESIRERRAYTKRLREEVEALNESRKTITEEWKRKRAELYLLSNKEALLDDVQKLLAVERLPVVLTEQQAQLERNRLRHKRRTELVRERDELMKSDHTLLE